MHDEELAACGIGMHSSGHGQNAFGVLQIVSYAVSSEFTLDAVAGATTSGAVRTSTLDHETADDTVEDQTVIEMLVDQADKIVNGFGCNFRIKLAFDHTAILHSNSNNRILCHNNFLSFGTLCIINSITIILDDSGENVKRRIAADVFFEAGVNRNRSGKCSGGKT